MRPGKALAPILYRRALAQYGAGNFEEAQDLNGQVLQMIPTHLEALRLAAMLARQAGDLPGAIEYLERAQDSHPNSAEIAIDLGFAHRDFGNLGAALHAYGAATRLKPADPDILLAFAEQALRMDRVEDGRSAIDAVLRLAPAHPGALNLKGIVALLDGGLDFAALERFFTARAIDPKEDPERRWDMFDALLREYPKSPAVIRELVDTCLSMGREALAVDILLQPNGSGLIAPILAPLAGLVLCAAGRPDDAVALIQQNPGWDGIDINEFERLIYTVVEMVPDITPSLFLSIGDLNKRDAVAAERLIRNTGISLFRRQAWRALERVMRRGTELDPENHYFAYMQLHALLELGEFEAAIAANELYFQARYSTLEKQKENGSFFVEWALIHPGLFKLAKSIRETRVKPFFEQNGPRGIPHLSFEHAVSSGRVALPGGIELGDHERRLASLTQRYAKAGEDGRGYPLVLTLCVRDELDLVEANLAYHFHSGVDCAIVTDNGSTDGTRQKLGELARKWPILIIDEPKTDYNQPRWTTRMAYLARDVLKADWVILGDADEFWQAPGNDIPGALRRCLEGPFFNPQQIFAHSELMIPDLNRALSPDYRFHEATAALREPLINYEYHWLSIENALQGVLSQAPKTWVKASDVRLVAPGNHYALTKSGRFGYFDDLCCLHFHTRSFEHYRRKTKRNFEALETGDEMHRSTAYALLVLYRDLERNDSYLDVFRRQTLAAPFMQHARTVGRLQDITDIDDFVRSGMRVEGLEPLPDETHALSSRYCSEVESLLPKFIVTPA